jgi:nicotinamide riboside kinase
MHLNNTSIKFIEMGRYSILKEPLKDDSIEPEELEKINNYRSKKTILIKNTVEMDDDEFQCSWFNLIKKYREIECSQYWKQKKRKQLLIKDKKKRDEKHFKNLNVK